MIPTKNNLCPQTQGKDCCTGATSATHHRHMSPYMVSSHSRENRHHPQDISAGCRAVIISGPSTEQSLPPYCGAGLVQFLVRFTIPPPQVTLQVVHAVHSVYPPFIGHGVVLQFLDSELGPSMLQSLPPFAGAGAVHDLVFCCIPPPQVALHGE